MIRKAATLRGHRLVVWGGESAPPGLVKSLARLVPLAISKKNIIPVAVIAFGDGQFLEPVEQAIPMLSEWPCSGAGPYFCWDWDVARGCPGPIAVLDHADTDGLARVLIDLLERVKISPAEHFAVDLRWD